MASFQDVRGAMAALTSDALEVGGVPFAAQVFDNVQETPPADTYAVINISFPQTVIEAIGCEGADHIIGSCNVVLYTPKGKGMKPAEDTLQAVIKAWVRVNKTLATSSHARSADGAGLKAVGTHPATIARKAGLRTRNISGPNALAPDQRPHQVTQLSCAFTARPA